MIQLVSRGCVSCALLRVSGEESRCAASGRVVPRELSTPRDCPARDGVLVTTSEREITIHDLVIQTP